MAPKRTIDRSHRARGLPKPPPSPAKKSSHDSSIDVDLCRPKAAPSVQDSDSSNGRPKKNQSALPIDESDSPKDALSVINSSEGESGKEKKPTTVVASAKKKKRARSTALKSKQLKPVKKSQPKTKRAKAKKVPSDESESGYDSSASKFEPDAEEEEIRRPTAPKIKRLKLGKKSRPKIERSKKKKASSDDESEIGEESESEDDSNASLFEPDAEEEESDESDESWRSVEVLGKRKFSAKKPARGQRRTRQGRVQSDESEVSWKSDDDDESETEFKTPVRASRGRRSSRRQAFVDSYDDNEEKDSPRRSTPSRRSADRARDRIHKLEIDETYDNDDIPVFSSRKKKTDEDDVFDPAADDDDVDEESADDEFEEESSVASGVDKDEDTNNYAGDVDADQDFLTADESSNDERAAGPSPMLDIEVTPGRRILVIDEPSSDSADDEMQQQPALSASPHMPDCPSKVDAVTMDSLPDKHICYFPPDQQTRQCFALETLHKIALRSSIRKDGRPTFLEPPHFRAPATDDLIDQIASRFGRAAMDLGGDFYSPREENLSDSAYNFEANLNDDDDFQEHLAQYITRLMGNQDIYCCPLCYMESHRRSANLTSGDEDDSDEESKTEDFSVDFWHDPMTVLGFPDNNRYNIASMFCFFKIHDVKCHVREAHNVDTKVLNGNDLFSRFKVRAGDGLLQRYIERIFSGRTYQGQMRSYWNIGNNQTFVFLFHLMKRRALLQQQLDAGQDDTGEAAALFGSAQDFYRSFESLAKQTWDAVSAPYRKGTKGELQDFMNEVDEDMKEDALPHFVFQRDEVDPEKEIIESLKRRRRMSGGDALDHSSDDNDQGGSEDAQLEDSDQDAADIPGYYSEEDEEEDEWVKKRLPKKRRGEKMTSPSSTMSTLVIRKRLGSGKKKGGPKLDKSPSPTFAKKPKRDHRAIIDSDSDSD